MPLLLLKGPPHLPATTTPLASKFTDNFATEDATKWAGYQSAGTGVVVSGGQLVIPPSTSYHGLQSQVAYRLTDESVFVQAVQLPAIADNTAEMFLRALVSSGHYALTKIGR